MSATPDYWYWQPGQVLETTKSQNGRRVPATTTVDEVVKGRSTLVANGAMTVREWLDEARELWRRDHPNG